MMLLVVLQLVECTKYVCKCGARVIDANAMFNACDMSIWIVLRQTVQSQCGDRGAQSSRQRRRAYELWSTHDRNDPTAHYSSVLRRNATPVSHSRMLISYSRSHIDSTQDGHGSRLSPTHMGLYTIQLHYCVQEQQERILCFFSSCMYNCAHTDKACVCVVIAVCVSVNTPHASVHNDSIV